MEERNAHAPSRTFDLLRIRPGAPASADPETKPAQEKFTSSKQALSRHLQPRDVILRSGSPEIIILLGFPDGDDAQTHIEKLREAVAGELSPAFPAVSTEHATLSALQLAALLSDNAAADGKIVGGECLKAAWMPVWDATKEALTTYWLTPVISIGGYSIAAYDTAWIASRTHRTGDFLSTDLANLANAIEQAESGFRTGLQSSLSYSIHATTLQNRERRRTFLGALYETPARLRSRLFGLIAEIEPGTPPSAIAEWVGVLLPATSEITIQLHESDTSLEALDETGAATACFMLPALQSDSGVRDHYARHIQRWATALRRQQLNFRLDNIRDPALLSLALAAGAEFLTSELFWPGLLDPGGVRRFPRSQIGQFTVR